MVGSRAAIWVCAACVVVSFALVRLPLLHAPFEGEDGMFARIMRASWASGQTPRTLEIGGRPQPIGHGSITPRFQGLVGRLDGRDLFTALEHPAFLYRLLGWIGHLGGSFVPSEASASIEPFLRGEVAAAGLLVWLPIVLISFALARDAWSAAVAAAACCSPLPAFTSTMIQIDGSVGVLMAGALSVALLAATRRLTPDWFITAAIAAAGFVLGLGKQEWSIAGLAGITLYLAVCLISPAVGAAARPWRHVVVALVAAIAAGNAASYLLDPLNYLGGFRIMGEFGLSEPTWGGYLRRYAGVSYMRLPMLVTLLPILAVVAAAVAATVRRAFAPHPAALLLCTLALAMCGSFLASAWNSTPRYLAPGFVVAVSAVVAILPAWPTGWARRAAQAIVVAALAHTAWFELRWYRQATLPRAAPPIRAACVPRAETAVTWNRPDLDFVSRDIAPAAAADIVAGFGRALCSEGTPETRQ